MLNVKPIFSGAYCFSFGQEKSTEDCFPTSRNKHESSFITKTRNCRSSRLVQELLFREQYILSILQSLNNYRVLCFYILQMPLKMIKHFKNVPVYLHSEMKGRENTVDFVQFFF